MADGKTSSEIETQLFATAISSPIAKIYVNGFLLGQSFSDMTLVCQTNGTPSVLLNMSFTTAKSLAVKLNNIINTFEEKTKHTILTIDDIRTTMEQ